MSCVEPTKAFNRQNMFSSWPRTAQQMGRRKKRKESITFPFPECENLPGFYTQHVPCHLHCSQAALSWQQLASLLKLVGIVACALWECVWWEYELVSCKRLPPLKAAHSQPGCAGIQDAFLSWVTFEADSALSEVLDHTPSQILSCTNSRIKVFMFSTFLCGFKISLYYR